MVKVPLEEAFESVARVGLEEQGVVDQPVVLLRTRPRLGALVVLHTLVQRAHKSPLDPVREAPEVRKVAGYGCGKSQIDKVLFDRVSLRHMDRKQTKLRADALNRLQILRLLTEKEDASRDGQVLEPAVELEDVADGPVRPRLGF